MSFHPTPSVNVILTQPTENTTIDLSTFASHASRTTITTDDVLLITRRNEALEGMIRDFIDGEKAKSAKVKAGKAGKKGGRG